jgi:hypothetical protein
MKMENLLFLGIVVSGLSLTVCLGQENLGPGGSPSANEGEVTTISAHPEFDAPREFTDAQGGKIKGRIVGLEPGWNVVLTKDDGTRAKLPLAELQTTDLDFVQRWFQTKIVPTGKVVQIQAVRKVTDPVEYGKADDKNPFKRQRQDGCYEITFRNTGPFPVGEGFLDYMYLFESGEPPAPGRSYLSVAVPAIGAEKAVTLITKTRQLISTVDNASYTGPRLGSLVSHERLTGIWLKYHVDTVQLGEFADSPAVKSGQPWPRSKVFEDNRDRKGPTIRPAEEQKLQENLNASQTASELSPGQEDSAPENLTGPREFRVATGDSVRATIAGVEAGGIVALMKEGGMQVKVKHTDLVPEDQKVVSNWYTQKVLVQGRSLQVSCTRVTGRANKSKATQIGAPENILAFDQGLGAVNAKFDNAFYEVNIRNVGALPLEGANLVYILYKKNLSDRQVSASFLEKLDKIEAGANIQVDTRSARLARVEDSKAPMIPDHAVFPETRERLVGVWMRVYLGKAVIAEFADPAVLAQKESWPKEWEYQRMNR